MTKQLHQSFLCNSILINCSVNDICTFFQYLMATQYNGHFKTEKNRCMLENIMSMIWFKRFQRSQYFTSL